MSDEALGRCNDPHMGWTCEGTVGHAYSHHFGAATWRKDATPPLVAASPVPPVVPDSDNRAQPLCCCDPRPPLPDSWCAASDHNAALPSGSGVVPDKPALALCHAVTGFEPHYFIPGRCVDDAEDSPGDPRWCNVCGEPKSNAPVVPAVTDDEAAARVIGRAIYERPGFGEDSIIAQANAAVAALHAAGFLIVHHTKET